MPTTIGWLSQVMTEKAEAWELLQTCQALAKQIKMYRQPKHWTEECGKYLPTKGIADQLLATYLRTFEPLYRIVHVPTLKLEYDRFWEDPKAVNTLVILEIQLCLAIGACFFDDKFTLRTSALQWIHEAKMWSARSEQSRLSICGLQILCLLQVARQCTDALHEDLTWISAGSLYQTAICMGLQVDPSKLPKMSLFDTEIRRRLWATIVELLLQSSLDSGGPLLLTSEDFSCKPPTNLNDSQLVSDRTIDHVPQATDTFTDTSLQITLRQSLLVRLQISKQANNANSQSTYEEVLRLHSELAATYRDLKTRLCSFGPRVSAFQRLLCDTVLQQYFLVLHLPHMHLAMAKPILHFSRAVCVETALSISYTALMPSLMDDEPVLVALYAAANTEPACGEYIRLMICGSGPFRYIHIQSHNIIAAELLALMHNEIPGPFDSATMSQVEVPSGAGRGLRKLELHAMLRAAAKWTELRLVAGETNVKDYVAISVSLATIEAVMEGVAADSARQTKGVEAFTHAASILRNTLPYEASSCQDINGTGPTHQEVGDIGGFWLGELGDIAWEHFEQVVSQPW
ncbi:hypothetical protein DL768_008122 [Monosporascus sp. mg162]|nr:hypothetical protein DL768_008122 [Monosporascus sp. mg162]